MAEFTPIDLNKTAKYFFIAGLISLLLVVVGYFTGLLGILGWFLYVGAAMILVGLYFKMAAKRQQNR